MIKLCKCGGDVLVIKAKASGEAELHLGIDGEDLGMEMDGLTFKYQRTVYCACGKRRRDLRYDKIKGLIQIKHQPTQ